MLTIEYLTKQAESNFQELDILDFKIVSFEEFLDENDKKGLRVTVNIIVSYEDKFYRIIYTLASANSLETYIETIDFVEVTPANKMTTVWIDKNE